MRLPLASLALPTPFPHPPPPLLHPLPLHDPGPVSPPRPLLPPSPSQDPGFRKHLLSEICKVGASIETALEGIPQDIEGVVAPDGAITVVQTRPQV